MTIASKNSAIIKSIFLLLLAVSGNFVAETLSCKTRLYMSNHMVVKQLVVYMMIYFTLHFVDSDTPHPLEVAKKAVIIWLAFIMFTKMSPKYTLMGFIVLIVFFILTNFIDYEKSKDAKTKKVIDKISFYEKGQELLFFLIICITVTGFISYMMDKHKEYGDEFDIVTFLMGKIECKNT